MIQVREVIQTNSRSDFSLKFFCEPNNRDNPGFAIFKPLRLYFLCFLIKFLFYLNLVLRSFFQRLKFANFLKIPQVKPYFFIENNTFCHNIEENFEKAQRLIIFMQKFVFKNKERIYIKLIKISLFL